MLFQIETTLFLSKRWECQGKGILLLSTYIVTCQAKKVLIKHMPVFAPSNRTARDLQVQNTCHALYPKQLFLYCQQHSQLHEIMMKQCFKAQLFLQGHIQHPPTEREMVLRFIHPFRNPWMSLSAPGAIHKLILSFQQSYWL